MYKEAYREAINVISKNIQLIPKKAENGINQNKKRYKPPPAVNVVDINLYEI